MRKTISLWAMIGFLLASAIGLLSMMSGCTSAAGTAGTTQPSAATISLQQRIARLAKSGISGVVLQNMVMARCAGIAPWNRPYRFNGVGDCYGYCRQVWNAILADGSPHSKNYYPHRYNPKQWINLPGGLPVNDYPDPNWIRFSNPDVLVKGDLLATAQGHFWGPNWHGGIYAGNGHNWDCSKLNGLNGAYKRPLFKGFHYYYQPLHKLLVSSWQAQEQATDTHSGGN
jgi:hypothetical protein